MERSWHWNDCRLLVGVALLTRLGLLLAVPVPEGLFHPPDSAEYDRLGRNLLREGRLSLADAPPWEPDLTRTPVYPAFVAACYAAAGPSPLVVVLAQCVVAAGTCLAVYAAGARLFGRRPAVVAAGLVALDPLSVRYATLLLSETLFTALFAAGLLCAAAYCRRPSAGWAVGTGLSVGLAVLCRPIAALWPPVLVAWMVGLAWRHRSWRPVGHAALVLALVAPMVGAWVTRNSAVGGLPVLSTIPGINLYYHRAAAVVARQEQVPVEEARQRLADRLHEAGREGGLGPAEEYRLMEEWGWHIVSTGREDYLRESWDGAVRMMGPQEPLAPTGVAAEAVDGAERVFLVTLYALAAYGTVRCLRGPDRYDLLILPAAVLYLIVLSGPEAYPRFRVPVVPALALLAGACFRPASPLTGGAEQGPKTGAANL